MNNSTPPLPAGKKTLLAAVCATHAPLRFALLHHTGIPIPHFDLLIEIPGWPKLLTWRIPNSPDYWHAGGVTDIGAHAADDHRPLYLTYEGTLSNDRGSVERVAAGTLHPVALHDNRFEIELPYPMGAKVSLPLS